MQCRNKGAAEHCGAGGAGFQKTSVELINKELILITTISSNESQNLMLSV